jgi:FdhE protein
VDAPRTDQELLAALREAREQNPELTETVDLHEEVVSARSTVEVSPPEINADVEKVNTLLDQRVSLLQSWELDWDVEAFSALAAQICEIGARHRNELASGFEEVDSLLTEEPKQRLNIVTTYLKEGKVEPEELANETRDLLLFVLINSLHPFLWARAAALTPLIEDQRWYQRQCPVCEGEPDFGYLEETVGGLRLLCSRCDTVWTYRRGECTFCGNADKETFAYYLSDDDIYRLYVCDNCKRYLKVLDGRKTSAEPMLPMQRIITVGMDVAARQEGYQ